MAVSLGKRKREVGRNVREQSLEDEGALRARFQQAFEAKFKPLERSKPVLDEPAVEHAEEESDLDESDWDGLSGDEKEVIDLVDHKAVYDEDQDLARSEKKAFMSSKPPVFAGDSQISSKQRPAQQDEDSSETANLKNDLALQRLLKESHLLDPSAFKGTSTAPEGKGRLKALDLRLKDLGAKESISDQQKMPQSHRKGIRAKASSREEKRRKDAAENGVILERARAASSSKAPKHRQKSVGGPNVGRFKGGTLTLSSKEVKSIQSQRSGGSRRPSSRIAF